MRLPIFIALGCTVLLPGIAAAQEAPSEDSPHGQISIGAGVAPSYEGSDKMRAIPFLLGDVQYRGITLQLRGLRAQVDLASDSRFSIGPVIGARLNRHNADGPSGPLTRIGTAIEAGGFVGYRFGGDALGQGAIQTEVSLVHDVSGTYDGLVATGSVGYTVLRKTDRFLAINVQTTWADADYTRTYFGVTPADATQSGFAAYRPGAGFKDVGAGLTAGYSFSRHWGVTGRVGASYLVGDAADSPITESGSRWQPMAGLTLSYRF